MYRSGGERLHAYGKAKCRQHTVLDSDLLAPPNEHKSFTILTYIEHISQVAEGAH